MTMAQKEKSEPRGIGLLERLYTAPGFSCIVCHNNSAGCMKSRVRALLLFEEASYHLCDDLCNDRLAFPRDSVVWWQSVGKMVCYGKKYLAILQIPGKFNAKIKVTISISGVSFPVCRRVKKLLIDSYWSNGFLTQERSLSATRGYFSLGHEHPEVRFSSFWDPAEHNKHKYLREHASPTIYNYSMTSLHFIDPINSFKG